MKTSLLPLPSLVNGAFCDVIPVNNRGLAYGDGVFETIRIRSGAARFLPQHLERLQRACSRLSLDSNTAVITNEINRLLDAAPALLQSDCVIKIILARESSGRGYKFDPGTNTTRIIMLTAAPDYDFDPSRGVAVRLCNTRLAINPVLAGIKHLSRLENVLARNEWHDSTIVEGLMMDTAGHLVEGTMSNIFVLSGGRLITPALTRCGVEGIIRQIIIEQLAPALSIPLVIRDMDISDVIKADSVFICNSLIGICPVRNIGCHHKRIDKTLLALITALEKLQGV